MCTLSVFPDEILYQIISYVPIKFYQNLTKIKYFNKLLSNWRLYQVIYNKYKLNFNNSIEILKQSNSYGCLTELNKRVKSSQKTNDVIDYIKNNRKNVLCIKLWELPIMYVSKLLYWNLSDWKHLYNKYIKNQNDYYFYMEFSYDNDNLVLEIYVTQKYISNRNSKIYEDLIESLHHDLNNKEIKDLIETCMYDHILIYYNQFKHRG